jgi:anthranilate synthase component 2
MLLLIDNYDSFTYNLVQYFGELGEDVRVARNDEITLEEIAALKPARICISPGPCSPAEAGISLGVLTRFGEEIPILGVCLGHQAIGHAFGGKVIRARELKHGKTDAVTHGGQGVFTGLPSPFTATRYHSLAVERATLPDCLEVTAWTADGEIMGLRHRRLPVTRTKKRARRSVPKGPHGRNVRPAGRSVELPGDGVRRELVLGACVCFRCRSGKSPMRSCIQDALIASLIAPVRALANISGGWFFCPVRARRRQRSSAGALTTAWRRGKIRRVRPDGSSGLPPGSSDGGG